MGDLSPRQFLDVLETFQGIAERFTLTYRVDARRTAESGTVVAESYGSDIAIIADEAAVRKFHAHAPYQILLSPTNISGQGWTVKFETMVYRVPIITERNSDQLLPTVTAFGLIEAERERQDQFKASGKFTHTCADPMDDLKRFAILSEEVGEIAHAINEGFEPGDNLLAEVVQVAAVCVAWIESHGIPMRDKEVVK